MVQTKYSIFCIIKFKSQFSLSTIFCLTFPTLIAFWQWKFSSYSSNETDIGRFCICRGCGRPPPYILGEGSFLTIVIPLSVRFLLLLGGSIFGGLQPF